MMVREVFFVEGNKGMEKSIRELTGGRGPAAEESVKFEKPIRKSLKSQRLIARIYVTVGLLIIAGCAVRVYAFSKAAPMAPGESIVYGVLALTAGGIGLVSIRLQMRIRYLYQMFKAQNYVVWGCRVRKTKGNARKETISVKVTTLSGDDCEEWFPSDTASAREAEKGLPHDYWLLVFPRGNKVLWSKLISDGQLAE